MSLVMMNLTRRRLPALMKNPSSSTFNGIRQCVVLPFRLVLYLLVCQSDLATDNSFLGIIAQRNESLAFLIDVEGRLPHFVVGLGRRPTLKIDTTDINRLRLPTARLNGQ